MEGSPNVLAFLALLLCPLVSFALVAMFRAPIAVPIIIIAGQMFLPPMVAFDAPLIPPLGKDLLPPLSALFACLILRPKSLAGRKPGRGYDLFIVLQIAGFLGTCLTNRDPVPAGPITLPAHSLHDFFSGTVQTVLYWWPPFFLGRSLYRKSSDLKSLFVILAVAGVIYTPFLLIEMKFSPQFNRWIYGFHQTQFMQTLRASGYRPKVFMRHGLNVAFFMAFTLFAAAALSKARARVMGFGARGVAFYLLLMLALCRSAGALVYTAVFLPLIVFTRVKTQARWAAIFAVIFFSYPVFRTLGLVPVEDINHFFLTVFGETRAGSLAYRLQQEGVVMERALQRIVFGWGGYGRPFPHSPWTGRELFYIDGLWAIQIGGRGVVGYVAMFGMLLLPAWRARKTLPRLELPRDKILVACLALMAVVYVADLIPNSSIDPYLTFLVGVLAGTERGFESEVAVAR